MALTLITDVVVPEIFNPYVIERTATLSALWQSGIVGAVPNLAVPDGGRTVNMPFWQDLSGNSEVLPSDGTTELTAAKIASDIDVAVIFRRGKMWSANDLAGALAGSDPMAAVGNLVAAWWARDMQTTLINVLTGVFLDSDMSGNVHDISSESGADAVISASTFIDAAQLLGDSREKLTAFMCHSAVEAALLKADLIDTIRDSQGQLVMRTFMGKQVVVDDSLTATDGVYTSYLFGQGAIGYAEGSPAVPTATTRNEAAGNDYLVSRRYFILHPRGVAWQAPPLAGESPTNAEVAADDAWSRVYEAKNVRMVQFKHRIAAAAGS